MTTADPPGQRLIEPYFLKKLEALRVRARRAFPGVTRGERRSTRKGASVEFADFRKYEAGDDFRHVDWNIYARLERLMLRQFVEEQDLRIDVLVDVSGSMAFGQPITKLAYARRTAAIIAFVATGSHDRLSVSAFDSVVVSRLKPLRGQRQLFSALTFLDSISPRNQETNLNRVLQDHRRANTRPGVSFIISDFLDPNDFRRRMRLLAHSGYELNLIQVMTPEELDPRLAGDLMLIDSETGAECDVTIDARTMTVYRRVLTRLTEDLEAFCRVNGFGYVMVTTDKPFEDSLVKNLIDCGMIG